jgi:phage terminase large subunit-like protein
VTTKIPAALLRCDPEARAAIVASLPKASVPALNGCFAEWAHAGQIEPEGNWRTWVVMARRGFGKTRAGAE